MFVFAAFVFVFVFFSHCKKCY